MKSIDEIHNVNDLMIELEAQLHKNKLNKGLLIREAFTLWYVLVEGVDCESFTEEEIIGLLKRNYSVYKSEFVNDSDYSFIMGWMISITFWYFDSAISKEYGNYLLMKSYQSNPKNSLFKWAVRSELNLRGNEINNLEIDISLRFDQIYNYGTLIKDYFLDVINTPHPN